MNAPAQRNPWDVIRELTADLVTAERALQSVADEAEDFAEAQAIARSYFRAIAADDASDEDQPF